ncbi:MAG: hypothetical protein RLZZ479_907 [Bacteroidota bacterium]|jgi:hypothetical protein
MSYFFIFAFIAAALYLRIIFFLSFFEKTDSIFNKIKQATNNKQK